jgi:hypothetical protein
MGKQGTIKMGPTSVLTEEEFVIIVTWILGM